MDNINSLIAAASIFSPLIAPYSPYIVDLSSVMQTPNKIHIMGTDAMGRDIFSRILYGGRVSLSVGIFSVMISTSIGIIYGGISGYKGGKADSLMMRLLDTFLAIPSLIVILALRAFIKGGAVSLILIIGCISWMSTARIVRSQFIELKQKNFVKAAVIMGTPTYKIFIKHLLKNSLPEIVVMATLNCAQSIFMEVSLSFLGIGIPLGTPSWGNMLNNAQNDILSGAWWVAVFPGITIILVMLSINFIGDYLKNKVKYTY